MIALWVVSALLVALLFFMWIAVGMEKGPSAADVAIAYERAWDDLDFRQLYDLSGDEMRDGMRRDRFVTTKRAAYEKAGRTARMDAAIEVENTVAGNQTALVVTRVESDGGAVRNNVMLEKRSNGWVVVGYSLRNDTAATPDAE